MLAPILAGPSFQMWATFGIIVVALVLYATERLPMEVVSVGVVCALLVLFSVFPVTTETGASPLSTTRILQGFANPALVTVLALLVMGQGMVRTGVLDRGARLILAAAGGRGWLSIAAVLVVALVVSGFLNNIPVVVIFIPVMQSLAARFGISVSKVMIPLSFAAVLGGMTTLVGSGTNLLVNSALIELGEKPFGFFDFTVPGALMAGAGLLYVLLVAPRFLSDRASLVRELLARGGRQFITQIEVSRESALIGAAAPGGLFPALPDVTIRMVQRGEDAFLPPFEGLDIRPGDLLVVAATRKALTEAFRHDTGLRHIGDTLADSDETGDESPWLEGERSLAEAMVTPASRYIGMTLAQIGFHHRTRCVVLGVQRRSRMIRTPMTEIRLQAGDVLLILGQSEDIGRLRRSEDVVLIEWTTEELPVVTHARRATLIFAGVIALAASGAIPIVVATLMGAVAMIVTGTLNIQQARRAVDAKVVVTIGAALAMGVCMQHTGGAGFLAGIMLDLVGDVGPASVLSLFFLLVAALSNIISTKTSAVLFTPIAIDIALQLGVAPQAFAVAVVFAANCSFASPLGYQTNLLVMGPGHYRFIDFSIVGTPLIFVLWGAFTLIGPWYFGL